MAAPLLVPPWVAMGGYPGRTPTMPSSLGSGCGLRYKRSRSASAAQHRSCHVPGGYRRAPPCVQAGVRRPVSGRTSVRSDVATDTGMAADASLATAGHQLSGESGRSGTTGQSIRRWSDSLQPSLYPQSQSVDSRLRRPSSAGIHAGNSSLNRTRSLGQVRGLSGHAARADCAAWRASFGVR
jgi:hypothetical protein